MPTNKHKQWYKFDPCSDNNIYVLHTMPFIQANCVGHYGLPIILKKNLINTDRHQIARHIYILLVLP